MREIKFPTRHCAAPGCFAVLVRHRLPSGKIEDAKTFGSRKFCGIACRGAAQTTKLTRRTCRQCGEVLKRKRMPCGRIYALKVFNRAMFCGKACWQLWYSEHARERGRKLKKKILRSRAKSPKWQAYLARVQR